MAQAGVTFYARWARQPQLGIRRRDGCPYLAGFFVWLLAPRAEDLFQGPKKQGCEYDLLSSMSLESMGPSMAIEGSTTKEVSEAYMEHFLASMLRRGAGRGDGQPLCP